MALTAFTTMAPQALPFTLRRTSALELHRLRVGHHPARISLPAPIHSGLLKEPGNGGRQGSSIEPNSPSTHSPLRRFSGSCGSFRREVTPKNLKAGTPGTSSCQRKKVRRPDPKYLLRLFT